MARPDYFFICGVGRSGTTALRKSLGLHPALDYNGHENNVICDVIQTARQNCTLTDRKYAMVVSQTEYDRIFERALNDLVWRGRAHKASQIRTAAFDPWPGLMDYLFQVFPNSKMLYLVRNGIEVVASRQLFRAFQAAPFEKNCELWLRAQKIVAWGSDKPEQFFLFRYEWFSDPARLREGLSRLYQWLDITWNDAPLEHFGTTRYHPTQHPQEGETRTERWRNWTDQERATFQALCGQAMLEFDYPIPWLNAEPTTRPSRLLGQSRLIFLCKKNSLQS